MPGVAPAAKQQGRYVAKVIAARIEGRPPPRPFVYRDAGNLATIGRRSAVIEFPFMTLRGFVAWWIWGIAHIYFLVGVPSPEGAYIVAAWGSWLLPLAACEIVERLPAHRRSRRPDSVSG